MEPADEIECGACTDTVSKVSAVTAGWKVVMDSHYEPDLGRTIVVPEWQCGSCAPGAHSENAPGNATSGGIEITDELAYRLADEAEQGYPTKRLRRREEITNEEKARRLRERAAIERAEADEIESDHDVSPGRAMMARRARQLARDYERAADRLINQAADALIRRVMPQIPEEYREGFELTMAGGEYAMAIDDLAALVSDHRIELSSVDAAALRALTASQDGQAPPTS